MPQNANKSLAVRGHKSNVSKQRTKIDQFAPEKISVFKRYRSFKLEFSNWRIFSDRAVNNIIKPIIKALIHTSKNTLIFFL